ncbi:MAG: hypothetical protein ABFD16_08925 [Thermoguttaceae bacterium]
MNRSTRLMLVGLTATLLLAPLAAADAAEQATPSLRAGVAKVDITNPAAVAREAPLYARALVLSEGDTTVVLITVDAVAIGEIGPIGNDYLATVRSQLEQELKIRPANVLINASHCHGQVCSDVAQRTVQAVQEAWKNLAPVNVGAGSGREDRIMENRRLRLKSGREADVRHAYSLPPDEEVAGIGPVDPEIGVLRLDRKNGQALAVVYNFACHPIQGVPSGGNTADLTGFASKVVEDHLGDGVVALFVQGCAGDVNPVTYKDVGRPRDAEPLGNLLGLSTLAAARKIACQESAPLRIVSETLPLPRADHAPRIASMQAEQTRLLKSLKGTSLNLKTFVPLFVKYSASGEFPSYSSHAYLHDKQIGRDDWARLDAENRRNMEQYIQNIHTMEELTRVQANLALLEKHQARNAAADSRTIDIEVVGLRVGPFVLVTFPGELSVEIGLNIKQKSPHPQTFVAGYTNGYLYYAPTEEQLKNAGCAQEDCDCLLAPGWQNLFENKVADVLQKL